VIVDEWGVWHPEARRESGHFQRNTLRDALVAASVLDAFHRQAHRLTMANIAQAINVWLTPTWHVFEFYKAHMGNLRARCDLDGVATFEAHGADGRAVNLPAVSASASLDTTRRRLLLTAHNRHLAEPCVLRVECPGVVQKASARVLTSRDVGDYNDQKTPRRVRPRRLAVETRRRGIVVNLPPHSLIVATIHLA